MGVARIEIQANSNDAAIVDLDQRSDNRIVHLLQFAKFLQTEGSGVRAKMLVTAARLQGMRIPEHGKQTS